MLPGIYAAPLVLDVATADPLEIVATGAGIVAFTALRLSNGAKLKIRGVELVGQNFGIDCGNPDVLRSELEISEGRLMAANESSNLITAVNCKLAVEGTTLLPSTTGSAIGLGSDAEMSADRLHLVSNGAPHAIGMLFRRVRLVITNSILENAQFNFATNDTTSPGSAASLRFNTIVMTTPSSTIECGGLPENLAVGFENNVIASTVSQAGVVNGNGCLLSNNILHPQTTAVPDNLVADPEFLDAGNGNFRVNATSPAVDGATNGVFFNDHDFDDVPRPQGRASDIGAFEQ